MYNVEPNPVEFLSFAYSNLSMLPGTCEMEYTTSSTDQIQPNFRLYRREETLVVLNNELLKLLP